MQCVSLTDGEWLAAEDGILHLQLCKADKVRSSVSVFSFSAVLWLHLSTATALLQGEPWTSAVAGHNINPLQAESETKRLLLERFQEEVRPGCL